MHFKDKLEEEHNFLLSYETIRKILIEYNLHKAKKRKKVYRRRRRMPKAGMLIQMDSSEHNWIPSIKRKWHLTATIDDATNEVPFAKFYPSDGVFNNMEAIKETIKEKGIFYCLYVDKASHFKTTRYEGLHVNVSIEQDDTQIERALTELNINLILANSSQAKGRIKRLFGTFQDRLIKELRVEKIKNYQEANMYLKEKFLPYYNKKFAYIKGVKSVYKSLPSYINLDLIFSKKYERKVNHDNTIKFKGEIIQIPPSRYRISFAKCLVNVFELEDRRVYILYKSDIIHTTYLSKNNKNYDISKKIKNSLDKIEYYQVPV